MDRFIKIIRSYRKWIASLAVAIVIGLFLVFGFYGQYGAIQETQELAEESKVFEKYNIAQNQVVIFLDVDDKIVRYTGDKTVFGYQDEEIIGKPFIDLFDCSKRQKDSLIISCPIKNKYGITEPITRRVTSFSAVDVAGVSRVVVFQKRIIINE